MPGQVRPQPLHLVLAQAVGGVVHRLAQRHRVLEHLVRTLERHQRRQVASAREQVLQAVALDLLDDRLHRLVDGRLHALRRPADVVLQPRQVGSGGHRGRGGRGRGAGRERLLQQVFRDGEAELQERVADGIHSGCGKGRSEDEIDGSGMIPNVAFGNRPIKEWDRPVGMGIDRAGCGSRTRGYSAWRMRAEKSGASACRSARALMWKRSRACAKGRSVSIIPRS